MKHARVIISMLLSKFGGQTKNGSYSVRSGYRVNQDLNRNSELGRKGMDESIAGQEENNLWSAVQKLDAPHKLRGAARIFWQLGSTASDEEFDLKHLVLTAVQGRSRSVMCFFSARMRKPFGLGVQSSLILIRCSEWIFLSANSGFSNAICRRWKFMSSYGGYIMFGLWRLWKRRNSLAVEIKCVQLMDTVMMLHNNRENLKIQNQGKRCWSDTELPLFIFSPLIFC